MSSPTEPIRVGIGLIRRSGRYLIRQRPASPGSPMPGLWEFAGGKCQPSETPAEAAVRECREETGLEITLGPLRQVTRFHYPHGFVELHYFDAHPTDPLAEPDPALGFIWVEPATLLRLTFPPANAPLLAELASEANPSPPPA